MFDDVLERVQRLVAQATEPAAAAQLVVDLARLEHAVAAAKATCARRVAESGRWRLDGARSEADWLATHTGETVGAARAVLEAAQAPATTAAAFASGSLSVTQAAAIAPAASTDPDAEPHLLRLARTSGIKKLREACDRIKAAADPDPEARHARIHASRSWRRWTDADGARCGSYRLTPEAAAIVEAAAVPFTEAAFRAARAEGRHEPSEAYEADGFVGMAGAVRNGDVTPPTKPGWPRGETILLVNLESLHRGSVEPGEDCEIPGVGPVPVAVARELLGDSLLKLVIRDGQDIRTVVHLGRHPTAAQQTALYVRERGRCARPTCDRPIAEIDHTEDWSRTHQTTLDQLAGLCRPDHALKTRRNHTYRRQHDGSVTWHPPP